jgi:drug/metabolite transporter (DMT)-like permease
VVPNLLAGLASVLWGTADFLGGFAATGWRAERVALISQAVGSVLLLTLAPILTGSLAPAGDLAWGAAAGVTGAFGAVLLYRSLAIGPMNVAAPTIAVVAAIVPAAVGLLQGERPSGLVLVGVALAVAAVALVGGTGSPGPTEPRATGHVIVLSALAGAGLGLANVCFAQTAPGSGLWPVVATKLVALVAIGTFTAMWIRGSRAPSGRNVRYSLATGVVDAGATASLSIALQRGSLVAVSVLGSLFPAVTVVLARWILHERMVPAQAVGIALALVAIAMIVAG